MSRKFKINALSEKDIKWLETLDDIGDKEKNKLMTIVRKNDKKPEDFFDIFSELFQLVEEGKLEEDTYAEITNVILTEED